MNAEQQRLELFYAQPFFKQYPGFAEAIVEFETEMKVKLPTEFHIDFLPFYEIEDKRIILGKIHTYYVFGMIKGGFARYQLFDSKGKLKLYFIDIESSYPDFSTEDVWFWTNEVDKMK